MDGGRKKTAANESKPHGGRPPYQGRRTKLTTVRKSKSHGGGILYQGNSVLQAVKAARRDPCSKWGSACKCGGAEISQKDVYGVRWLLHCWQAAKPGMGRTLWFWRPE